MYSVIYFGIFICFFFGIPAITMNDSHPTQPYWRNPCGYKTSDELNSSAQYNRNESINELNEYYFEILRHQLNIVLARIRPMESVLIKYKPPGINEAINRLPGKKGRSIIRNLAKKSTPKREVSSTIIYCGHIVIINIDKVK